MKNFNMLAICVVMLVMLAFAYYWEAEMAFEKENPVFMGLYSEGFEYEMFASCAPLPIETPKAGNEYAAVLKFAKGSDIYQDYPKYFNGSYRAFFIKFRGKLTPVPHSWMGVEYTIEVTEVLEVRDERDSECNAHFYPGLREITTEYDTEPPEEVFKRLKSEAFQKVE